MTEIRTAQQVLERIEAVKNDDMFGWRQEVLFGTLTHAEAVERWGDKVIMEQSEWDADVYGRDRASVMKKLGDYMDFAWGKVEDHRGLSAGRSVEKVSEYVWLLDRGDVLEAMQSAEYAQYGAPKLAVACRLLGLPIPTHGGVERMIKGEPCRTDCQDGCGR